MAELPPEVFELLRDPPPGSVTAVVATVDEDGAPHTAPFGSFCAVEPRRLRFGCDRGHVTFANLMRDPGVAVFIAAPPAVAVSVFGRAAVVRERMELIDSDAILQVEIDSVKDDMLPGAAIDTATTYSVAGELTAFLMAYLAEIRRA